MFQHELMPEFCKDLHIGKDFALTRGGERIEYRPGDGIMVVATRVVPDKFDDTSKLAKLLAAK